MIAGAVLLIGALATLALIVRPDGKATEQRLSPLEREAVARFAGSQSYVTMPDGRKIRPTNPAHELQIKVHAYQAILAKESEKRDPTFPLKAEAELVRRTPMQAGIEWTDVTGNREMTFTIEDSSTCALDGRTELTINVADVTRHPCLAQGGTFWDPGTQLTVHLVPITNDHPLWAELLSSTKKSLATEAHLASLETAK